MKFDELLEEHQELLAKLLLNAPIDLQTKEEMKHFLDRTNAIIECYVSFLTRLKSLERTFDEEVKRIATLRDMLVEQRSKNDGREK